jgi:apolipoprotein D and lipocalin family protein
MRSILIAALLGCSAENSTTDLELPPIKGLDNNADVTDLQFVPDAADGASVEQLEPSRYLGLWYEIATSPSQQQTACSGTTAEYSLVDDSTIGVTNRCRIGGLDGGLSRIDGTARVLDDTYARLLVDLGFGFEAPYTVIDLVDTPDGEPYSQAVVSGSGVQFWVLSRTPEISDALYDLLLDRMEDRGIDSSVLIPTEQVRD